MDDEQQTQDKSEGGIFSNANFLIIVWVVSFTVFVCTPFCVSRYRRELWCKRIRLCQWNVHVDPERDPEWYRLAMERYETYRTRVAADGENGERRQLTREEEEEVRQLYLLERMAGFTMAVKQEYIREKDGVEKDDVSDMNESVRSISMLETVSSAAAASVDIEEGTKGVVDVNGGSTSAADTGNFYGESSDDEMENVDLRGIQETAEHFPAATVASDVEEGIKGNVDVNGTSATDNGGFDGESSDDEMGNIDFSFEETNTFVGVPFPGVPLIGENRKIRFVPNGCAVCLCEFEVGERVTWSATGGDPHVFHEDCMMNYFLSVGSKASRRRRRHPDDQDPDQDPREAATDFPMLCPCCRQQFVSKISPFLIESDDEEDPKDSDTNEEDTIINNISTDNTDNTANEDVAINSDEDSPISNPPPLP
eukprot:CAMPEP_0119007036 /NCGR_PEP_ID=MMETSP1176-20130426/2723_1 /TAXON_ID=265551 /ORGANISM="Synedropsis recta cf, Strain CCMP1620" /LENGTH=423 /DNA_ID=CAMNT_0006959095 /DNA_START=92 /DNA_END=1359 /DNA_ORIENTATION=+